MQLAALSREAPILIAGPTASGKSGLAMELAARDGRTVVNADALQVYANWRILTARPSISDEAGLPHLLYGHIARDQDYSVGHWLREVGAVLDRPVVIVGGTGLYFRALTEGLAEIPPISPETRALADARMAAEGSHALLSELDGQTATRIDRNNPARVQRAWEVLHQTGRGLASWQTDTPPALLPLSACEPVVLRPEVGWLDGRIKRRFQQMMRDGALAEVESELPFWLPNRPSSRAIGAVELLGCLKGESRMEDAVQAAILASRQYAKKQRTWFRTRMSEWREIIPR
ncbi:MAG: tRNA (adenosine(37)-N6)-dimethylallyltransferase MiaA [Cypionkella sp.]